MKNIRNLILLFSMLVSVPVSADVLEVNSIAELKGCSGGSTVKYNVAAGTQVVALFKGYSGDIVFLWDGTDGLCVTGVSGGDLSSQIGTAKAGQKVLGSITGKYSGSQGNTNTLTSIPGATFPDHAVSLTLGDEGQLTPVTVSVADLLAEKTTLKYVNSLVRVHGVPSYYNYANLFFDDAFSSSIPISNDYNAVDNSQLNGFNNQKGYFTGICYSTVSRYNTVYGLNIVDSAWFNSEGAADALQVAYDAMAENAVQSVPYADVKLDNFSVTGGQFNTFCVPFAVKKEVVDEVFGAETKVYCLDGSNCSIAEGRANFALKVYDLKSFKEIPAGLPVVVVPERAVANPVFRGVSITSVSPGSDIFTDWGTYEKLLVKGTYSSVVVNEANSRLVTADGKIAVPTTTPLAGFTAYLVIPSIVANAEKPEVNLIIEGVLTSIGELFTTDQTFDAVYELSGRKIVVDKSNMKAGIYLIDGKKVIIK